MRLLWPGMDKEVTSITFSNLTKRVERRCFLRNKILTLQSAVNYNKPVMEMTLISLFKPLG